MTNSTKYYIWLSLALGFSSPKYKAIYEQYPDISELYDSDDVKRRLSGVLKDKDLKALSQTPLKKAYDIISRCNELGINILSIDDPSYPERLRDIYDPPAVLYVLGRMPDFNEHLSIAMVGTRNATVYGKQTSHVLAGSLASVGVVIVSGGAVGIDSLSHTAALEAGGITVCVLGCGINYPYLMNNAQMRAAITKRGALVSEYPPDHPASKFTFPERNRIISGLSDGVVVVEAGIRSGSLITARCAAEQGRDVFAVMGNITSPYSAGANALIKDGAIPVTEFADIISNYPSFTLQGDKDSEKMIPEHRTNLDLDEDTATVYRFVTAEPIHIDLIISGSGLPVRVVLQALTELELDGLIKAGQGRMYKLI